MVIWTKFELAEDPETGMSTPESAQQMQAFVDRTIGARMQAGTYACFKNWRSLKSVHAVEHFHVMLYDPDPDFVKELTNGDVPMSARCS